MTITAAGDYGAGQAAVDVLSLIGEIEATAHLALGDLSYGEVTESEWCALAAEHAGSVERWHLVAGNHETLDNPDASLAALAECLPGSARTTGDYPRQYFLDLPATEPLVRLIQVSPGLTFPDGTWTYRAGGPRDRWLDQAVRQARADGIAWVVVSAHLPCQSLGVHSCPASRDFYDRVVAAGVDLVLHGHEHAYARTHQLQHATPDCQRLPVDGFAESCIADRDDEYAAGAGTVFTTSGTGGAVLRPVATADAEEGFFAAASGWRRAASHGVLRLDVTDESLAAAFIPVGGGPGEDRFVVTR